MDIEFCNALKSCYGCRITYLLVRLSVVMLIVEVNMGRSTLIHCCELIAGFGSIITMIWDCCIRVLSEVRSLWVATGLEDCKASYKVVFLVQLGMSFDSVQ